MRAYNGKLFYHASSFSSMTEIASVRSMTPPVMKRASYDESYLAAPSSTRIFSPSWIDPGEATFTLVYAKAFMTTLHNTIFSSSSNYFWKVQTVDGDVWQFKGHITSLGASEFNIDDDDLVMTEVTIKVSESVAFIQS